jgi:hypothetical protein
VAAAVRNEHYDTEPAYLAALGRALQVEYETIVGQGFVLQIDCPDLALERHISFQDRPPTFSISSSSWSQPSTIRCAIFRAIESGCIPAGKLRRTA